MSAVDFPSAGAEGEVTPTVFSSAGGQVSLPCANQLPSGCSSTTWIYSNASKLGTVEEVGHGIIKQDSPTNRSQRLMVASDCSLTITPVTVEDAGLYICQQFPREGGQQEGDNAPVYLAVLQGMYLVIYTYVSGLCCHKHNHTVINTTGVKWKTVLLIAIVSKLDTPFGWIDFSFEYLYCFFSICFDRSDRNKNGQ